MKKLFLSLAAAAGLLAATAGHAQVPANAPTGSTGLCKDGTFYTGASKKGACTGHKGVKTWYGASGAVAGSASVPAVAASAVAPVAASSAKPAAAGTGSGQVWGNMSTKVYHCPGDKYYGKTKNGAYMTEADAKTKGFHADHGKPCQ